MPTTERRGWFGDDRGVVAMSGLAMAVFMTAVLYYEIGVGDAITFHEQLQDASDATGFAAAVYHAKGMNMIVLINLIMAAVLAIIVVLRVLQAILGLLLGLAIIACIFTDVPCAAVDPLGEAEDWVGGAIEDMDPIVHTALKGLNTVSTAIAVGMPWVALIKSATVGPMYYPQVTSNKSGGTVAVSISLIPTISWIPAVSNASNSGKAYVNDKLGLDSDESDSSLDGKRWGLPVVEGEYSDLCENAALVVPDILEYALAKGMGLSSPNGDPPTWLSWINKAIGTVIGSFPEYFCDAEAMGVTPDADIAKNAKSFCDGQSKVFDKCVTQQAAPPTTPPTPAPAHDPCGNGVGDLVTAAKKKDSASPKFDDDGCNKDETKKLTPDPGSIGKQVADSPLPKAIFPYAANGNDYMAIWSFGWGDFKNQEQQGVSIASWNGLATPASHTGFMLAKAEFFYAVENYCEAGTPGIEEGTKGSGVLCGTGLKSPFWGDYAGDTMWNPRWKARMRRVAPPMIPIGQIASSGLQGILGGALEKAFKGGSSSGSEDEGGGLKEGGEDYVKEFITSFIQIGGGEADGAISGALEKAAGYEH